MGFLKNLVTFGAQGRIDRKLEELDELKEEYEMLYSRMERRREEVNQRLQHVIRTKVKAVKSLKQIQKVSKNIKGKDRDFVYSKIGNEYEAVDFRHIDQTISAGKIAMSATKGLSAGVGTALGAWALVSTLGSASTGAAIAGLSGVAATNATLAWFGGGALAAGGGGVMAGTTVLGGIVAIPALAIFGVFNHLSANKKIAEIEREMRKIVNYLDEMEANLLKLELIEERSEEIINSVEKATSIFEHEMKKTLHELNPIPLLSRLIRLIRKYIFWKNYYTQADVARIGYIGGLATELATLIDTPVFDED